MTTHCLLFMVLEEESCNLIDCFFINFMKANPSKFQAICMGKGHVMILLLLILIQLKLILKIMSLFRYKYTLYVTICYHVSQICRRTSKQLAVLKRIGRFF